MPPRARARVGDRGVVAAVSGGADSVAMLRLLHAAGVPRLSVAHLDHHARGAESAADARFVAALADELKLPFDLGGWSPARPAHFEADARAARYAWLAGVARSRGAGFVATGHTRDDQAETILFRILRGTGPSGLAGMPRRRRLDEATVLIRPVLHLGRAELRAYLDAIGQPHREDASNADLSRTRSRIRHDLLPRLAAEYNPRVAEALVRLGGLAAGVEAGSRRDWGDLEALVAAVDGRGIRLRGDVFRALPIGPRVEILRRAWRRLGWPERDLDAARWRRMARGPGRDGRVDVGGGVVAEWSAEVVRFRPPGEAEGPPAPVPAAVPGSTAWAGGVLRATLDPAEAAEVVVDPDALVMPLSLGGPGDPGERFDPLGMGGHTQTIDEFLRGRRIPRCDRAEVPTLRDARGVVWVVGHRIAHRVRLTGATSRTLGLSWDAACR